MACLGETVERFNYCRAKKAICGDRNSPLQSEIIRRKNHGNIEFSNVWQTPGICLKYCRPSKFSLKWLLWSFSLDVLFLEYGLTDFQFTQPTSRSNHIASLNHTEYRLESIYLIICIRILIDYFQLSDIRY